MSELKKLAEMLNMSDIDYLPVGEHALSTANANVHELSDGLLINTIHDSCVRLNAFACWLIIQAINNH